MKNGKIKQSKTALIELLKEQFEFIIRSCNEFDVGNYSEAKRIAASIRILLHDTRNSHSLFSQLNIKSIGFLNTAIPANEKSKASHLGLLKTEIKINEDFTLNGTHKPLLDERPSGRRARKRLFPEWWNEIVLVDMHGSRFSRRELVLVVANTDGGSHVDPELNIDYARLSRENSIGYAIGFNEKMQEIDKSELVSIRQIAHEILTSIYDRYPDLLPISPIYNFKN